VLIAGVRLIDTWVLADERGVRVRGTLFPAAVVSVDATRNATDHASSNGLLRSAQNQRIDSKKNSPIDLNDVLNHKRNIQHTVRYTELSPTRFKDFWPSDRGCKRYDLRPFGLFCLCPQKSAILTTPARGRCLRKLTKCSRIRIATSFTVWRLGSTDFMASVIRIISWSCCSTSIDKRVSVGGTAAGSSGEVADTIESAAAVSSSEVVNGAAGSTEVDSWEKALNDAAGPAAVGS
jgi:hypothetical protein